MSFQFQWPVFDAAFKAGLALQIEEAINQGLASAHIIGRIAVSAADPGTVAPELECLEIGELGLETFKGMFRLAYRGDACITLQLEVQMNPLHRLLGHDRATSVVPLELTVSRVRLDTIFLLSVHRTRGVSLTFKNDPLESMQISSSFDGLGAVKDFLQAELEAQVREALRTEVPKAINEQTRRLFAELAGPLRRPSAPDVADGRRVSLGAGGPIVVRTGGVRAESPTAGARLPSAVADERLETASQCSGGSRASAALARSRQASLAGHAVPVAQRLQTLHQSNGSLSATDLANAAVVHSTQLALRRK